MKSFALCFLVLIFSLGCMAMDKPNYPKLNYIFNYELLNQPQLDAIFAVLALELSVLKDDENSIIEFLRRQTKKTSIDALALYLHNSEKFSQLRENIQKVTNKVSTAVLEERELEGIAAKILVVVIRSEDCLKYFIPIMKKYEDYIEICSSEEIAHNKAFIFFCFYILSPILYDLGKELENKNLINLAAYIQKSATLYFVQNNKSSAGQQVLDILDLLQKQFHRDYYFSEKFSIELFSGLMQLPRKIKDDIITIEKKAVINWLHTTYILTPRMADAVLYRLVSHKFLSKKAKKIGKSTKYIIRPHTQADLISFQ